MAEHEFFKLVRYSIDVTAAREMIASGELEAKPATYPVKKLVESLFKMDPEDFGSNDFTDDVFGRDLFTGPPVNRKAMKDIPTDKLDERPLFAEWKEDVANAIIHEVPPPNETSGFWTLIDGNHRLIRRYLEGDEGEITGDFVAFEEIIKVTKDMMTKQDKTLHERLDKPTE